MALSNIRVVLVQPTHPGNIGATARAMKNMCLDQLVLVAPQAFPDREATARAAGADDVLARARVCDNLDAALDGCHLAIGTTARSRTISWPTLDVRACAQKVVREAGSGNVALVFGRERMGLTNAEVDRCHFLVTIPANQGFSSLNLACAVQILAYEIYLAAEELPATATGGSGTPVDSEEMRRFYRHLEQVLVEIEFLDPNSPRKLMRRLRRLFNRAAPDSNEMNILRGILTAVQQAGRERRAKRSLKA